MTSSPLQWRCERLSSLDAATLYRILQLRAVVFVLEQRCLYLDPDGLDPAAWHLQGYDEHGHLQAYARILPPRLKGAHQAEPAIGRVLTAAQARGQGLGRLLVQQAIVSCDAHWPGLGQVLSAQAHLQGFYQHLGFVATSEVYDEDGIPHIDMRRPPQT